MGFIQSPFRIRYLGWPRHISGRVQSLKRSSNQNQIMEALTMRYCGRKLNERNVESSQGSSRKTSTRNVDQILAHILAINLKIRVQPHVISSRIVEEWKLHLEGSPLIGQARIWKH